MTIKQLAIGIAAVLLTTVMLSAHDEYRVIGTVTKITASTLTVKQTKDGKVLTMKTDANTLVTRDKKKVARTDIKAGGHVVVDALGDTIDDLLVVEVRLVPAPATKEQP
jgi:hypothetical protein